MTRVLNFLLPIRDSLLKIKAKLCQAEKFEYKVVDYSTSPDLIEMNSFGSEGWELVSVTTLGSNDILHPYYQLWFKRRL